MTTLAQRTVQPPGFDDFSGNYHPGTTNETVVSSDGLEGATLAQSIILDSGWTTLFGFSLLISLALAVGIIYSMLRTKQVRKMEEEYYGALPLSGVARRVLGVADTSEPSSVHQTRWREVVEHVNSESENDWRQAILEADVMLDDAITRKGYAGEGLGEKMKQVQRSDINSIDDAWEAHKMRNRVAHEGSSLELTQREARRIINLYERVFRELGYITD